MSHKVTRVCANYTGLVTRVVYCCSHEVLQAVSLQRITWALQITRVYLHDPCTCVSPLILLAFFWQRVTQVWGLVYTIRVLCISSNSPSLDLSKLSFALPYSEASPKYLKRYKKYGIKSLTIEITKINEFNYYA